MALLAGFIFGVIAGIVGHFIATDGTILSRIVGGGGLILGFLSAILATSMALKKRYNGFRLVVVQGSGL